MSGAGRGLVATGGAWRARFRKPDTALEWRSIVPARRMGARGWARSEAAAPHDAASATSPGDDWPQAHLYELTYVPVLRSKERAVAWAALREVGAVSPFRGWIPGAHLGRGPRDNAWRGLLADAHAKFRERLIGHGDGLPEIMASLNGSPQQWEVEAYRDTFGAVNWVAVQEDIHKAAMGMLRQTPYGMVWVDEG